MNVVSARLDVAQPEASCGFVYLTFWMPVCGNILTKGWEYLPGERCGTLCPGNSSETCGGHLTLNAFWNGHTVSPEPSIVKSMGSWTYVGCFE
jgi:hypothetical protein